MSTLSIWARQHIVAARLLIALLHLSVFGSAVYLSQLLQQAGIYFSRGAVLLVAVLGFGAIGIAGTYRKQLTNRIAKTKLQKMRFLLMGLTCALLVVGVFSIRPQARYYPAPIVYGAFTTTEKMEKPASENYTDKQAYYKDLKAYYSTLSKKELRKELRRQLKEMKKATTTAGTIAVIFLVVILVSIALYLIAGLACSLSCNGQEGLAILVLVGGTIVTIGLAVLLIRAFRKWEKKQRATQEKPAVAPAAPNATS